MATANLSGLWHDWLLATEMVRNDRQAIANYRTALGAVRRRMALRDASALDVISSHGVPSGSCPWTRKGSVSGIRASRRRSFVAMARSLA